MTLGASCFPGLTPPHHPGRERREQPGLRGQLGWGVNNGGHAYRECCLPASSFSPAKVHARTLRRTRAHTAADTRALLRGSTLLPLLVFVSVSFPRSYDHCACVPVSLAPPWGRCVCPGNHFIAAPCLNAMPTGRLGEGRGRGEGLFLAFSEWQQRLLQTCLLALQSFHRIWRRVSCIGEPRQQCG